jgi:hypothetical protein
MALTGRIYTVSFQNVTITAVQDLFTIIPGTTHVLGILALSLGQITGTTVANARIRMRRATSFTAGSGGSTPTPAPFVSGDVAATFTAHANDTTQSTSTFTDLVDDVWNTVNGYLWVPPVPSRPIILPTSSGLVVSLDTALSSLVCNGSITVEELP